MSVIRSGGRLLSAAAAATVVLSLGACGSGDSSGTTGSSAGGSAGSTSSTGSGKPVEIAVLTDSSSPYGVALRKAASAAAAKFNASVDQFDAVLDPTKEVAACQDAITRQKYKAIIVVSIIPTAGVACAKAAKRADIPLVTTFGPIGSDTSTADPTVDGVTSQVIAPLDDQLNALVDGTLVPACAKFDPCQVAWLRTSKTLPQADAIINTLMQEALRKHPSIKLVGQVSTELDAGPAITATKSFLQRSPDLNVVLSYASQGIVGAAKALRTAGKVPGKDVLLVSSGASTAIMDMVRSGEVYGTTVNLPTTEMTEAVRLAAAAARGQAVPKSADPLKLGGLPLAITQENLAKYPDFKGQYEQ